MSRKYGLPDQTGNAGKVLGTNGIIESWVPAGGGGGGVSSFNSLTGAVTISAGSNITLTPTGNDIEISAAGITGAFSNITGTPTEIAYFDALGNGTSDAKAFRLANGTTGIGATFGNNTLGYSLDPAALGALPFSGNIIDNPVVGQSAYIGAASLIPFTGVDTPAAIFLAYDQNTGASSAILSTAYAFQFNSSNGIGGQFDKTSSGLGQNLTWADSVSNTGAMSVIGTTNFLQSYLDATSISLGYPVVLQKSSNILDLTASYVSLWDTSVFRVESANATTVVQSAITFTGAGLNDVTATGAYISSIAGQYEVEIIGNDGGRLTYGAMTAGNFNTNDTVTGSISGATATVYSPANDNDNRVWVYNVTGVFQVNDVLTNGIGDVSDPLSAIDVGGDLFEYTVSGNSFSGGVNVLQGIANSGPWPIGGISPVFGAPTGHTPGDKWNWTETPTYSDYFMVDPANGNYYLGDAGNTNNNTWLQVDDTNKEINLSIDGTVYKGSNIPQTIKVPVTSAEILAISTTPKQILPTPGAGKAIQVLSVMTKYTFGTVNYAGTTQMSYRVGVASNGICFTNVIGSIGANAMTAAAPVGPVINMTENAPLTLSATGNPTNGDGTVDVYVTYQIITL